MKKIVIMLLITLTLLTGCSQQEMYDDKKDTTPLTVEYIMENYTYQIIDVRTKEEFDTGHVKGAINIPVSEITTVDLPKDTYLIVYCKSGGRSKSAYEILTSMGYNVFNLRDFDSITLDKE